MKKMFGGGMKKMMCQMKGMVLFGGGFGGLGGFGGFGGGGGFFFC